MKIMNPTAMNRYNALREAAGKIDRLVPQVRLLDQPPHENRENASVALEFPTPLVVLNSTIRQALSFLFCLPETAWRSVLPQRASAAQSNRCSRNNPIQK